MGAGFKNDQVQKEREFPAPGNSWERILFCNTGVLSHYALPQTIKSLNLCSSPGCQVWGRAYQLKTSLLREYDPSTGASCRADLLSLYTESLSVSSHDRSPSMHVINATFSQSRCGMRSLWCKDHSALYSFTHTHKNPNKTTTKRRKPAACFSLKTPCFLEPCHLGPAHHY